MIVVAFKIICGITKFDTETAWYSYCAELNLQRKRILRLNANVTYWWNRVYSTNVFFFGYTNKYIFSLCFFVVKFLTNVASWSHFDKNVDPFTTHMHTHSHKKRRSNKRIISPNKWNWLFTPQDNYIIYKSWIPLVNLIWCLTFFPKMFPN